MAKPGRKSVATRLENLTASDREEAAHRLADWEALAAYRRELEQKLRGRKPLRQATGTVPVDAMALDIVDAAIVEYPEDPRRALDEARKLVKRRELVVVFEFAWAILLAIRAGTIEKYADLSDQQKGLLRWFSSTDIDVQQVFDDDTAEGVLAQGASPKRGAYLLVGKLISCSPSTVARRLRSVGVDPDDYVIPGRR